jgi:aminoglycoside phosphotransferase (APT) family kinase protein
VRASHYHELTRCALCWIVSTIDGRTAPEIILTNTTIHPLIDLDRLLEWMNQEGLEKGPLLEPELLAGGNQSVLLKFRRGARTFVLRRPPRFPQTDGSETMRREARILRALAGTDVPHAPLIAACDHDEVLGAAFYLMEPIEGFNATRGLPLPHARDAALRHGMGLALVDGLLALGRIDVGQPVLAGLGRLDDFLERQVTRWRKQLDAYASYEGWPGPRALGDVEGVGRWLGENVPSSFTPGLMHGDYHIGNVMFRHDAPELAAIFDWELGTLGDPLLDFANLIATWPASDGTRTVSISVEPWQGFPTIDEMIACYRAVTHRNTAHLRWYGVLACYRLGILLEGTFARACNNKAPLVTGLRFHESAIRLFERAKAWIEKWPHG